MSTEQASQFSIPQTEYNPERTPEYTPIAHFEAASEARVTNPSIEMAREAVRGALFDREFTPEGRTVSELMTEIGQAIQDMRKDRLDSEFFMSQHDHDLAA